MISRRDFLSAAALPASTGGPARKLAEELRNQRRRTWLPFDCKSAQPPRTLKTRPPKLAGDPETWKLRARAIPEELWRPAPQEPYEAPKPRPEGNSGAPGYVLLNLTAAWLATGSDFYADTAIRTLRRVSEYKYWGGINGKPKDTDLHAGALLFGGAFAYDVLRDGIAPPDRAFIVEQFARHAAIMFEHHSKRDRIPWEQNHTYIDLGGLWCTAAALMGEAPEAARWMELGARSIKTAMYLLNTPDGAFYEGTHYWNFGFAQHLLPILEFYRNATGEDPFGGSQFLRNVKFYLMHTLLPGGRNDINLGDAGAAPVSEASLGKARYAMYKCASEYGDPECQFLAGYFTKANGLKPANDPWTLAFWDPSVESRDPRESWNTMHHFRDLGLVTARSSWRDDATHITLRCGPAIGLRATGILLKGEIPKWKPGTGHTHPDLNAILLYDSGEHLLVDTGYTWTKLVREHSTVAVDGGGQVGDKLRWPDYAPYDRHGRVSASLGLTNEYCYLRGDAAPGYDAKLELGRFDRNVLLMCGQGGSYVVLHDVLESSVPHKYEWILIAMNKAVESGAGLYRVASGARALTIRILAPDGLPFTQEPAIALGRGDQGGSSEQRGHRLVFTAANRKTLEVAAVLQLHAASESAPSIRWDSGLLSVSGQGWEDTIGIRGSAGALATDGHHASLRKRGSRISRWAVHDAKEFSAESRKLLVSSARVSVAGSARAMVIDTPSPADLSLGVDVRPGECTLDGRSVPVKYDGSSRLLRLAIGRGIHTVRLS